MRAKPSHAAVIKANVDVHTAYAAVYNDQPHFRSENQIKVRAVLESIRSRIKASPARLLDMGCGTGFVLHLSADLFDELHGVDVTPAMINQVDKNKGNILLHIAPAEKTPFAGEFFDCVTAYSFMDHLLDLEPFLNEVYRVLKSGGIFYTDQNANKYFWDGLASIPSAQHQRLDPIVVREISASLHEDEKAKDYKISAESFRTAEYIKFNENGIDPEHLTRLAQSIGFSACDIYYDWFLGQGKIMHQHSMDEALKIEVYLRSVLPLSSHLFKYLRFTLVK
jgi:ubiquinone/menaquinone biosynthesis C-methylase UbiE